MASTRLAVLPCGHHVSDFKRKDETRKDKTPPRVYSYLPFRSVASKLYVLGGPRLVIETGTGNLEKKKKEKRADLFN